MKVFVAMVAYNRANLLCRAIKSIEEQTYKPSTFYIIDNASTDAHQR